MGMTDLQFKSFLKMLIRALETAEKQGNKRGYFSRNFPA